MRGDQEWNASVIQKIEPQSGQLISQEPQERVLQLIVAETNLSH